MTKIDIFSGFLGAGKTTLIKKLIKEAYTGEKLVLIENEFGQIGIDGGFMKDAGITVNELNSGCICCTLVGDFGKALSKVLAEYAPDRILIEPSGVGKLSDVIRAVQSIHSDDMTVNGSVTVVDVAKCKMYMKNFGEFFLDQVEHASTIVLSHTKNLTEEKIAAAVALLREHNAGAAIVTTDWELLSGKQIVAAMEGTSALEAELHRLAHEAHEHKHDHHHSECHDPECSCHEHEHEHEHHHYDHDECHDPDCSCHDHEHHHEHHHHDHHHHDHDECHDPNCSCHEHHHHDADEVFMSFGAETAKKFTAEEIEAALNAFVTSNDYGIILRAKGIVASTGDEWIHFDYVPGEPDVRTGGADVTGRLCVIGSHLQKENIAALFGI